MTEYPEASYDDPDPVWPGEPAAPLTSEPIRLRSGGDFEPSILAALFGEMVRRAAPGMTHYQSDLFHDVIWMQRYITGPGTFYWVHRPMGTHIGNDLAFVTSSASICGATAFYRIDLTVSDREAWEATFTPVPR